jgi:hypothetical protein
MVGGLSESEYVQKRIQAAFPDINVMIPEDPEFPLPFLAYHAQRLLVAYM